MNTPAVLHVLPALGGGVDRYVRDIAHAVARPQLLWHVGMRAEVIETGGTPRFLPLDPAADERDPERLAAWVRAHGVGVVHLHSVAPRARARAEWLVGRLDLPLVVTLHDVLFLRRDAFDFEDPANDPAWIAEVAPLMRRARAVFAPSEFIAGRAREAFAGLEVAVVPNGLDEAGTPRPAPVARPDFLAKRPQRVVAILGAVGEHKGADLVRALPRALAGSGTGVVLIGYLDQQLYPGWAAGGGLYVHGPYHPGDAAGLLHAYGAELVLFPNRVPESFSYSLSEAWAAGLPVLACPRGAIGERVRRHGGGWLLDGAFDAAHVAGRIREILAPGAASEMARVKSMIARHDPERVPTLATMAQSLDAYYRRYGGEATSATLDRPAIDALLAPSLDATLFRAELAYLADLCDAGGEGARRSREFETEARAWIAKLEQDVADLQAEVKSEFEKRTQVDDAAALVSRMPRVVKRILGAIFRNARS